ncbi:uncharacterized protein [Nicotiana tomentosiformis]|uniref:uncharacterized protein n=1 Tax=Nicotiana tomentosiformis TaxID=4098 RepID=UPI00388C65A7
MERNLTETLEKVGQSSTKETMAGNGDDIVDLAGREVQLDAMAKEIRKLTLASIQSEPHAACDICRRGHHTHECRDSTEEVNIVGNYNFNAMGHRHPWFLWSSPRVNANVWQQNNSRPPGQGAPAYQNQQRHQFQPQQPIQPGLEDLMKIAIILSERALGTLPACTERNPKEIVNAVTLRSGQVLEDPTPIQNDVRLEKESRKQLQDDVDKKKKGQINAEKSKKGKTLRREEHDESEHMRALPFLQKLYREKLDKRFGRFLDVLKKVYVNLPFTKVLSQMPAYAKFLKEILTKKRKIEETSLVKLSENCSAILQNKLPQKKLEMEIGEISSESISLQLADQTTLIPEGIMEDVLVRVDKFVFPVDFIVVKMEEIKEVLLILGRSFLASGRAILDIH